MEIHSIIDPYSIQYDSFAGDVYTIDTASIVLTGGDITCDELTITAPTQDILWTADVFGVLSLQGQTSGVGAGIHFFSKDSDGTDNVFFRWFLRGTIDADTGDREYLDIRAKADQDRFEILSVAGGSATQRPIHLGMSATHFVLNANSTSTFGGALGAGAITSTGKILASAIPITPSFAFVGDTDTGLTYEGANEFSLYAGDTARLIISDGMVTFNEDATFDFTSIFNGSSTFNQDVTITRTGTGALLIEQTGGTDIFKVDTTNARIWAWANLIIDDAAKGIAIREFELATNKYVLKRGTAGATNDSSLIALCNRQAGGEVAIMADDGGGGAGGEVEVARFADDAIIFHKTARIDDKLTFTQVDGNEFIDSLADGYMDYGATTGHRFDANVDITGTIRTTADQDWNLGVASAQADFAGDTKIRVTIGGTDYDIVALAA